MSRWWRIGAVAVALAAATLRFAALDRQGLWDDESFTLRRLGAIPEPMEQVEAMPALYFVLLQGWTNAAGTSVASIRAFSALWGVAGVALAGAAAARMFSPAAGLFAGALVALHPFHIAYSQEARAYTMLFALAAAAVWAAWERSRWYVAVAAAALWTHPWGVFVWLGTAPVMGRWLAALPLALAAPALWHYRRLESFAAFWSARPDWTLPAQVVAALAGGPFYVGGWRFSAGWPQWLLAVGVCGVLWGVALRGAPRNLLIALAALVPLPLAGGLLVPEASAHQRYWMAALPAAVLLAARGWQALPRGGRIVAALALAASFALSTKDYLTGWQKGNIRQAAAQVHLIATPGDALIVPRYMQPLWRFYDRSGLAVVDEAAIDELEQTTAGRRRAIFVTLDVANPVREAMDARYPATLRRRYPAEYHLGLVLTVYQLRPQ